MIVYIYCSYLIGAYGQTPAQAAGALFTTLTKFFSGKKRTLQEVRVVLYDIKMIPPFVSAVESLGNKHSQTHTGGIVNWFKSGRKTCVFVFFSLLMWKKVGVCFNDQHILNNAELARQRKRVKFYSSRLETVASFLDKVEFISET